MTMLDKFTTAYIEAALWSSNDESDPSGGEPMDRNYGVEDIHPDTLAKMKADCEKFQKDNAEYLTDDNCLTSYPVDEQAGHDFWLTRCGHGCGFWETSDWRKDAGLQLTAAAKRFGECNLYVGDDEMIHL
jgi:hypothetical protein